MLATVEHNFFDEAPQQRLALSIRRSRVSPDLGEAACEADNFTFQGLAHPDVSDGLRRDLLSERFLSSPDLAQSRFPAPLEFRGDETIVGIDLVELPFGQGCGISLPFELACCTGAQGGIHLLLGSVGPRQRIKLGWRQRRQECVCHGCVDTRSADVLAGRQPFVGVEMIAHILPTAFVADVHLVPASRTPCDAVQQKIAVARRSSGFDAHVFGPVVSYDVADFFIGRPVDIGGIPILHDNPPILNRAWRFPGDAPSRVTSASGSDHRQRRPQKRGSLGSPPRPRP